MTFGWLLSREPEEGGFDAKARTWNETRMTNFWYGIRFCAGQDLKEVLDSGKVETPEGGLGGISNRQGLNKVCFDCLGLVFSRFLTAGSPRKQPIISAVNGVAMGGGFELALATDIIIASEKAIFALPEVKVGLAALGGGAQNLSKIIGYQNAMYYAMTGMNISAADALKMGIVQEVVKPDQLMKRALEIAAMITSASPDGVRATKAMAKLGLEKGWIATNLGTNDLPEVQAMFRSANMKEGTSAFSAKRKPSWVGYAKM